jgi:hypothetical protein
MPSHRPTACSRRLSVVAALAVLPAVAAMAPYPAGAQTGTLSLQVARLDGVATTTTLGVGWTVPLGEPSLPGPGEVSEEAVSDWLLSLGVGAGGRGPPPGAAWNALTVNGHADLLWRTGFLVERVGAGVYGNLDPLAMGPEVTARLAVIDVRAGGLWMEHALGLRWFAGLDLSLPFLLDVFAR